MVSETYDFAASHKSACRWSLKRDTTPRQFVMAVVGAAGGILLLSSGLGLAGFPISALACMTGLIVVGIAAYSFMRHARDGETITLRDDGQLQIDTICGSRCATEILSAQRVRLSPPAPPKNLLWLHISYRVLPLGRAVTAKRRAQFAAELCAALVSLQR